jgi:hypothetical protein
MPVYMVYICHSVSDRTQLEKYWASIGPTLTPVMASTISSPPPSMAPWNEDDAGDDADAAILGLEVSPADASIYVDDESRGSGREVRRLGLSVGRHRIDVVRPGYRPVTREVEVAPGEARTLDIELEPLR